VNWPDCESRRELEEETPESVCLHPNVYVRGRRVTQGICKACDQRLQPPPGLLVEDPARSPLVRLGRCDYLGDQVGERLCPTCGGSVRIKLFACQHPKHIETTLRDCLRCEDYVRERE